MGWLALLTPLSASAVSGVQSVVVSWNASTNAGVAGYKVYFGPSSRNYTTTVDTGSSTNYTITGLADGSTNYFAATTYSASMVESDYSDEVMFVAPVTATNVTTTVDPTPIALVAPTNTSPVLNLVTGLTVTTNLNTHIVTLAWNASMDAGVVGYQVYGGTVSSNYSLSLNLGLVTSQVFTGLVEGATYYFAVREFDALGNQSGMSAQVSYQVPVTPVAVVTNPVVVLPVLKAVTNLTVVANPANSNSVILSWKASQDTGLVGYRIYQGTTSRVYTNSITVGLVTNLIVNGLTVGKTNYFAATEYGTSTNESPLSSEVKFFVKAPVLPNQPPTLNTLSNLTVNMNAAAQTVSLSGISSGSTNESQTLKVTVASSKTTLIPTPTISYTSPNKTGTLTFKLAANATGTATITVTVNDGGLSNNVTSRSFTVTVVNALLPQITQQPTNVVALTNTTATMSVVVSGKAPFKYQWKFNGVNITGATKATLTLSNVKSSQSGGYTVQVSNAYGAVNSATAQLLVTNRITVTSLATIITPIAPTISTPVKSGNQFSFNITGTSGSQYVVQATSDLVNWVPVYTNTAPFTFVETNAAGFNQRFYRSFPLPVNP